MFHPIKIRTRGPTATLVNGRGEEPRIRHGSGPDGRILSAQTLMGPHMEGSDPHMEGSGVSNPWVLRDQGLFGASGRAGISGGVSPSALRLSTIRETRWGIGREGLYRLAAGWQVGWVLPEDGAPGGWNSVLKLAMQSPESPGVFISLPAWGAEGQHKWTDPRPELFEKREMGGVHPRI